MRYYSEVANTTEVSSFDSLRNVVKNAQWLIGLLTSQSVPSEAQVRRLYRMAIEQERASVRSQARDTHFTD